MMILEGFVGRCLQGWVLIFIADLCARNHTTDQGLAGT